MISINTQLIKSLPEWISRRLGCFNGSLAFKTILQSHACLYKIICLVSFYSADRPLKAPGEVTRDHSFWGIPACSLYPHPRAIAAFTHAQTNQSIISGEKLPLPKQLVQMSQVWKHPEVLDDECAEQVQKSYKLACSIALTCCGQTQSLEHIVALFLLTGEKSEAILWYCHNLHVAKGRALWLIRQ